MCQNFVTTLFKHILSAKVQDFRNFTGYVEYCFDDFIWLEYVIKNCKLWWNLRMTTAEMLRTSNQNKPSTFKPLLFNSTYLLSKASHFKAIEKRDSTFTGNDRRKKKINKQFL